jgi:CDP-diacylglycerol--inositol 3-phosphatidyltransferase
MTDRISFAGYALLLGAVYPEYLTFFYLLLSLDLSSHFFHLKASEGKASHKEIDADENILLRLYYRRSVLGVTCLTHDLFFITLYLYYFYPSTSLLTILFSTIPGVIYKTSVHIIKIYRASRKLTV